MGLLEDTIKKMGRPAILLGNGINQCAEIFPSWNELLTNVGADNIITEGLTNTEIYDFLELKSKDSKYLKFKVANNFEQIKKSKSETHQNFINLVNSHDCPVLTTNFDLALKKYGNLNSFRTSKKGFTRYYPWDTYFGYRQHSSPIDGFGVWHIHGMLNYYDSIRLGLTEYMGSVEKARKLIHAGDGRLFEGKDQHDWKGKSSWLHIWFNMPLIIVGFGLSSDEVFIRWLLIERKKYFQQFQERHKDTIFISTGGDERVKNFLNNLDIEYRVVDDYNLLYC